MTRVAWSAAWISTLVVAMALLWVQPAAGVGLAGLVAVGAIAATVLRLGTNHDAAWRRAWTALAIGGAAAATGAITYLVDPSWALPLVAALVGGAATVVAGVALFEHRVSRGRAIDVLLEGVLAGLAVALSMTASSLETLAGLDPTELGWLAVPLVYLAGVWVVVRAVSLSNDAPFSSRFVIAALAGQIGIFGARGIGPLIGLDVVPVAVAVAVVFSSVALAAAALHASVDERFAPVPVKAAGLTRAHVVLLVASIVISPAVAVWRNAVEASDLVPLQLAITILFPLLVVVHLVRQVQERASGEYRAQHDDLTGLPNRMLFHDRLEVSLAQARRQGDRVAVMFIDLDRFKRINDSLGHDVGDGLLQQVAVRLRRALREEDTVARLGGDEFAVLLHDATKPSDARIVGEKILEVFSTPVTVDERALTVGASVGVAMYPEDGDDPDTLLKHADIAMYRAKGRTQDNVQFYTPEMSAKAQLRLALEGALRTALDGGTELSVHYQPRVRASDQRIVGLEALLRWHHPTLGNISPAAFIPLAEESGLIIELGKWVFEEACRQNAHWRDSGLIDVPVSINLSARQFAEVDVEQLVVDTLRNVGLPPTSLELEITESILMSDVTAAADLLARLRHLGVRSSIDDFGTGYSGLSYLAKMPVDTLKIDRSFVADMIGEGAPIISAVVALARSLGLNVVAEGVETEGQVEALRMLECDEMQGFLYARPMPPDAIERLVRRWHARRSDTSSDGGHLTEQMVTRILVAASSESAHFDDLEAAHAVLSALSDRTPELRSLATAGLLARTKVPTDSSPPRRRGGPVTVHGDGATVRRNGDGGYGSS